MHNHQINISGGNDNVKYSISGGYLKQEGIAIGSDFERFSARVNIDNKITKWLSTGLRASVAKTTQHNTIDNGNIIRTAIEQLPDTPARNPDGTWGAQETTNFGTYFANPVAEALMRENYDKGTQMYIDFLLILRFGKGWCSVLSMRGTIPTATTITTSHFTTTAIIRKLQKEDEVPTMVLTGLSRPI